MIRRLFYGLFLLLAFSQCRSVNGQVNSAIGRGRVSDIDQLEDYKPEKEYPTYATDYVPPPKPPATKAYLQLYTFYPTDMLVGSECVTELTHLMGFEYSAPFEVPGEELDNVTVFFRNLATSTKLTFRNGPFWRRKVRRRIEECRKASGDFVG